MWSISKRLPMWDWRRIGWWRVDERCIALSIIFESIVPAFSPIRMNYIALKCILPLVRVKIVIETTYRCKVTAKIIIAVANNLPISHPAILRAVCTGTITSTVNTTAAPRMCTTWTTSHSLQCKKQNIRKARNMRKRVVQRVVLLKWWLSRWSGFVCSCIESSLEREFNTTVNRQYIVIFLLGPRLIYLGYISTLSYPNLAQTFQLRLRAWLWLILWDPRLPSTWSPRSILADHKSHAVVASSADSAHIFDFTSKYTSIVLF